VRVLLRGDAHEGETSAPGSEFERGAATISIAAAEVARPARYFNVILGAALITLSFRRGHTGRPVESLPLQPRQINEHGLKLRGAGENPPRRPYNPIDISLG
jgi:hypothetical protein